MPSGSLTFKTLASRTPSIQPKKSSGSLVVPLTANAAFPVVQSTAKSASRQKRYPRHSAIPNASTRISSKRLKNALTLGSECASEPAASKFV